MDDKHYSFGGQFAIPATKLAKYHTYRFHYLDDLSFMQPAAEALSIFPDADSYIDEIKGLFHQHGWEGDGMIQLFWLPPFAVNSHETHGVFCFHVKQNNNGTSWIASPSPLQFKTLETN